MRLYRQTFYLYRIVSYRKTEIWKTVDWLTIILYVVLVVAGWFSICGASYEFDNVGLFDPSGRPGSQLMWMGLSVGLIFVLLMLESEFFDVFAYLIYAGFIVLLIATIFLAPNIKGSHSWLVLGPVRLQPAEFAKFATALAVAKLMNTYGFKLTVPKNFIAVLSLIFLPMICILLQQETGSALVYLAFFLMLYREPCAANGANEEAVKLFLEDKIGFLDIGRLVEAVVDSDSFGGDYTLADVYECDRMARAFVRAHL